MQVFCGRNFANRGEWYDIPRSPGSSLLNMTRHQSLWENRQAPAAIRAKDRQSPFPGQKNLAGLPAAAPPGRGRPP